MRAPYGGLANGILKPVVQDRYGLVLHPTGQPPKTNQGCE